MALGAVLQHPAPVTAVLLHTQKPRCTQHYLHLYCKQRRFTAVFGKICCQKCVYFFRKKWKKAKGGGWGFCFQYPSAPAAVLHVKSHF